MSIVLLVGLVVAQVSDFENFRHVMLETNLVWCLAGMGLYLTGHLLRAVRLAYLVEDPAIPLVRLFVWSGLHAVWNYLLPARIGEVSLVWYLNRYENKSMPRTTAILVALRGLEGAWTLLLAALILLPFGEVIPADWRLPAQAALLLLLTTIGLIVWRVRQMNTNGTEINQRIGSSGYVRRVITHIQSALRHLQSLLRNPKWPQVMMLTVVIWLLNLGMYWALFPALGKRISILIVLMIVVGMAFTQVTPIQSFLSVGSHEIVWVPTLQIAGLSLSDSVSFAIGTHLLVLTFVSVFLILLAGLRVIVMTAADQRSNLTTN